MDHLGNFTTNVILKKEKLTARLTFYFLCSSNFLCLRGLESFADGLAAVLHSRRYYQKLGVILITVSLEKLTTPWLCIISGPNFVPTCLYVFNECCLVYLHMKVEFSRKNVILTLKRRRSSVAWVGNPL